MEYKLIASDLDETLLNDDHVVPESNIYWIQKAVKERGVKFVSFGIPGKKCLLCIPY